jgi:predicted small metal-binding protein
MGGSLKKVECDPKCGFMVRSHDEKELVEITKQHAKKSHNKDLTDKDIKSMIKDA